MTQKGELVLTAPPGAQRGPRLGDSLTAHLLSGPPWMAPKRRAWQPLPARPRSRAASVHSSPSAGEPWRNQVSAPRRAQGSSSPTLFTGRGQKPERDHERSAAKDRRITEPQPPGRARERVAVRRVLPLRYRLR